MKRNLVDHKINRRICKINFVLPKKKARKRKKYKKKKKSTYEHDSAVA